MFSIEASSTEKEIQEITDQYVKKVDEVLDTKEAEVMEI